MSKIDEEYQKIVKTILEEYHKLGTITKMAFAFEYNAMLRFENSKKLALAYDVEEASVLKTINDVDDFFMN